MKTIVIMLTVLGAAAMTGATATDASAQVLNLSGQFQCVKLCLAGAPALAYMTQNEWELNLVNEAGVPSRGWIYYPGHLWAQNWNEGAVYSADGITIQFDHGTVWQRVVEAAPPTLPAPRRHKVHKPHHRALAPANS